MKIDSQKLLPSASESLNLIAVSGNKIVALSTNRKIINFSQFISEVESKGKKKVRKKRINVETQLKSLKSELLKIEKIFQKTIKNDKNYEEKVRVEKEKTKRKKKEEELEKPKLGKVGANLAKKLIPTNIFDAIRNFIGNILLGRFVLFLLENVDKFKKFIDFIKPVASFLNDLTGKIFNGVVGLIEGAYDINERVKGEIRALGGEGAEKEFTKFTDAFKKYLNLAIILTMAGIPTHLGGGPGSPPRGPKGKPVSGPLRKFFNGSQVPKTKSSTKGSGLRKYLSRSSTTKYIEKKYGNSAAKIYESSIKQGKSAEAARSAVKRAIDKGKIKVKPAGSGLLGKGATRGGVFRRGLGKAGSRLQTRIMGRGARLGINRLGTGIASKISKFGGGRIPILGPLIVGISTYMETGKLDKALFLAGGSALGGFLGTFIPIPVLGTILGTFIGEYVGDLFYTLLRGGGISAVGSKLKTDILKIIDAGTLIKNWIMRGIGNIQYDDRFKSSNFIVRELLKRLPFKMGAWPILLDPFDLNIFRKFAIIKKAFFSESQKKSPSALSSTPQSLGVDPSRRTTTDVGFFVTPAGAIIKNGRYTIADMVALVKSVGGTDNEAVQLATRGIYESSGNPDIDTVKSGLDPNKRKEFSIGLFQVNWKAHGGSSYLNSLGIRNYNQLYDPVSNAKSALAILRLQGPGAWTTSSKVTKTDISEAKSSLGNWRSRAQTLGAKPEHLRRRASPSSIPPASPIPVGSNGNLRKSQLTRVGTLSQTPDYKDWYGNGAYLENEAAKWFIKAKKEASKENISFQITSAYRSFEHQKALQGIYPVVAKPGTSSHGFGRALDIQTQTLGYNWFVKNGPKFGWYYMAIPGDPVHFEWRGAPRLKQEPKPKPKPKTQLTRNKLGEIDRLIKESKPGSGERIKVPGFGTFVSGRNIFGQPEDKYFDQNGTQITEKEFLKKIKEKLTPTPAPNQFDPSKLQLQPEGTVVPGAHVSSALPTSFGRNSNLNTDILRTKASYESNQTTLMAIQPIVIEKKSEDPIFSGPVVPSMYS